MAYGYPLPKWKTDATTAPGVGDDIDDGYEVGSPWIDATADEAYVCTDNTRGAAVWKQTTGGGTPVATPTSRGQIAYSTDGLTFTAQTPLASDTGVIITEDDTGYIVVLG
jgi:hypothetical protein